MEILICQSLTCCYCNILTFQILYSTIRQEIALNGRGPEVYVPTAFALLPLQCFLNYYYLSLASILHIIFSWCLF